MSNHQALTVTPNGVADELLVDSVPSKSSCPCCGAALNKAFYADGDSERCCACGEDLWFELRGEEVVAHRANQRLQGQSLGELMRARQLRAPGSPALSND